MPSDFQPALLPFTERISARSQRQALDWSLVLASQGIEHVLDHNPAAGWALLVSAQEAAAARGAIRQSRWENRHWPWRKRFAPTGDFFDWAVVGWVVVTMGFFWCSQGNPRFGVVGKLDAAAVSAGEWWRLVTAIFLHADVLHLAGNTVFGFLLIGLAMGRHGTGIGLLAAFLAGVCGNALSWLLHGTSFVGLGASGVVMGGLGLVAVQSLTHLRGHPRAVRIRVGGIAAGLMLFVVLGLSPGTDVIAHLGGFLAGIALGLGLSVKALPQPKLLNLAAGLLLVAIIVGCWLLALR